MSENMPVNVEIDNGIGSVTFEDDVIAIIAGLAATEVKGVASMAGSMSSSLNEMLGKKDHTKGVKVEVGTEEAAVDLYLSLYYGISIPETCRAVQENVKKAVETMSGLVVSYVSQNTDHLRGSLTEFVRTQGLDGSRFRTILRKLDVPREQFEKDLADYSSGQKKKVLLAASLCTQAHLYVWDEPLNFIDVISRMQVEDLLLACRPTLLFVEHDARFCDEIATRRIRIQRE